MEIINIMIAIALILNAILVIRHMRSLDNTSYTPSGKKNKYIDQIIREGKMPIPPEYKAYLERKLPKAPKSKAGTK